MKFARTLRFRVTAWYCLALGLGMAVFSMVLIGMAEQHLLTSHDEAMNFKAHSAALILDKQFLGDDLAPIQLEHLARLGKVALFKVDQGKAHLVYRDQDLWNAPVLVQDSELSLEPHSGGRFTTLVELGNYWRVFTLYHRNPQGQVLCIRTLEELGDVQAALRRLKIAFSHLVPVGILVSLVGGWVLAGRALKPITNVINLTNQIEPKDLSQRLPHPGVQDEIGNLVDTLNHMLARIETSLDTMKRFTSDASHELRNPLATLRNLVDVTLEQPRSREEMETTLYSIGEEVDRIRGLVEDLLLLARADSGRVVMQMKPVSLAFMLEAQVEAHQPMAQKRDIRMHLGELFPDEVMGNERWLLQVISNLLSNAINYTPVGGSILLAMARADKALSISISDTGPGIPEEDLDRIFERFFRTDPSRSWGHVQGFGLGLAIVAWIVKEHGGSIEASNMGGGGATFTVTLPKAPPQVKARHRFPGGDHHQLPGSSAGFELM